jgi:hypothetical protein
MQTTARKPRPVALTVLITVALAATVIVKQSWALAESVTPASKVTVIELARQTLVFAPTRDDMTVSQVVFNVFASDPNALRVNGARSNSTFSYIDLKPVAKNQFELPSLKIEFDTNAPGALLCLSVKVWFSEVSNQYDSLFYKNTDDRYALVTWCSSSPDSSSARSRFRQNRLAKEKEFKEALSKPFIINLNQRPLRREWRP